MWKKKSSCSCGVGVGKTSPRGDAGIRAPKNPGLFFVSRAQNPGFCQGLTRPMRRWSRRAAASCARCQASSSWVLGKATAATRCSERRSVGSPQKAAELCGERREQKGRGAASGNPDGWVPDQPRVPRPAELTVSTRRAPISPVCPRRGPRQSCSSGPHLRGRRTDKRTRQMDRRTQQAAASPPCPKEPTDVTRDTRRSPIDGGRGGRHLLLDALQLEAVVLGGGEQGGWQRFPPAPSGMCSGREHPRGGSHLEELPQLLAGGLQALEAMLGTGKSHAGVLQRRQLAALHRPAGHGDELGV